MMNRRFVLHTRPRDLPGDEHFRIETQPVPTPEPGEALIKVLLAALSPWQNQRMKDFKNYTHPFAIGELIDCDVLGEVVSSETDALAPGQRVTGRLGWQAYAIAEPSALSVVTHEFTDSWWLTALSSPGLTAYTAMDICARPMPGQTLVVTSAAGAVGSYAVQIGKLAGMRVVGIAGGVTKCGLVVSELGADACIDHSSADFSLELAAACPEGVHLFFDTLGGPVADVVFDNLAKHANVIIVGRTASNNSERPGHDPVNMRQLWAREATIHGFSRYSHPERWAFARERMMTLSREGKLKSIDHTIEGFEQSPRALRGMLAGEFTGKTLVRYADG